MPPLLHPRRLALTWTLTLCAPNVSLPNCCGLKLLVLTYVGSRNKSHLGRATFAHRSVNTRAGLSLCTEKDIKTRD